MSPLLLLLFKFLATLGAPVAVCPDQTVTIGAKCHAPAPPPPRFGELEPVAISNGF